MKKWIRLLKDYDGRKKGDLLQEDESIARALVDAKIAEDGGTGPDTALGASIQAEMDTFRAGIRQGMEGIVSDIRAAAGEARRPRIDAVHHADKNRSFGDFVQCVVGHQKHGIKEAGERLAKVYNSGFIPAEAKDGEDIPMSRRLQEAVGSAGGYRVPEDYGAELLKLDGEAAVFSPYVRTTPMGQPVKLLPALRQTGTPASQASSMHAGVRIYRKSEKAQRTASEPAFDMIRLESTDLIAYTEATRDLLADAKELESDLKMLFRAAIAWKMEYEFLRADGVGKPLGVFNCPSLIQVSRSGGANTIVLADVLSMISKLLASSMGSAYWIANQTTIPQIGTLKDANNNSLFIANATGGARDALPGTLFGRPIRFTEKVPPLGTAGDLNLFDPGMYLHGLYKDLEIGVSEDFLFDTDSVAFRVKLRNDGKPWLKGTVKLADGANTAVSPFVQLL